jgi:peptidoglycan/xylan/chitin deacetylase (PgdA/CDA1 family)
VPWTSSARALRQDYARGQAAVADVLGEPCVLFRPPYGHLGPSSTLALRSLGLRPVLWTLDLEDWRDDATVDGMVENLGRPVAGDVLLMHDAMAGTGPSTTAASSDRGTTVQALPQILQRLDGLGLLAVAWPTGRVA